jgi:hypothetical protein
VADDPFPAAAAHLRPPVLARADWRAKPAIAGLMKTQKITHITVHHGAEPSITKKPLATKLLGLQSFSQNPAKVGKKDKPAWGDIPYHFYINGRGEIGEAREVGYAGDTNTDYNPSGHLLIALEGNFQTIEPTPAQLAALTSLLTWASVRWNVTPDKIKGHNDYAHTECPGKNLSDDLAGLRTAVAAGAKEAMAPVCTSAAASAGARWYCAR